MPQNNIQIFDTTKELANYFGKLIYEKSEQQQHLNIALSGGSTPKAIFDILAENYKHKIDWSKIFLFWGDERCVPPDDDESNYKMTKEHLLDKVPIPQKNIFRVLGELSSEEATEDYIGTLTHNLPCTNDQTPIFDLLILGMGDDGHTASIFPYEIVLWNNKKVCVTATHPKTGQKRVSLTGKTINSAKEIFFLVTGDKKAEKVDEIINKKKNYTQYPASLVKNPVWLLDKSAASLLGRE